MLLAIVPEGLHIKLHAAQESFYNLPTTALVKLCEHWKLPHQDHIGLYDLLKSMINNILPHLEDDEVAMILSKRLPPPGSEEDTMLACDEVIDELSKDLEKDVEEHNRGQADAQQKSQHFRALVHGLYMSEAAKKRGV